MTGISPIDFEGPARSRKDATGETSHEAAKAASRLACTLRRAVYDVLSTSGPMTPEEVTDALRASGGRFILVSIRARCSDLHRAGLIRDSGSRGIGEGGQKAIRWAVVPEAQYVEAKIKAIRKVPAEMVAAYSEARKLLASGARPIDLLAAEIHRQAASSTTQGIASGAHFPDSFKRVLAVLLNPCEVISSEP